LKTHRTPAELPSACPRDEPDPVTIVAMLVAVTDPPDLHRLSKDPPDPVTIVAMEITEAAGGIGVASAVAGRG
jgi:hypothetical protein